MINLYNTVLELYNDIYVNKNYDLLDAKRSKMCPNYHTDNFNT